MDFQIGNVILIIGLMIAAAIMIWQFLIANPPDNDSDVRTWHDDVDEAEETIEESEEILRRIERLSKRTKNEDEDKK